MRKEKSFIINMVGCGDDTEDDVETNGKASISDDKQGDEEG